MANTGLDAQHISTNLSMYEAARTSFFTFIIEPNVGENGNFGFFRTSATEADKANDNESAKITNIQEIIRLNVTRASVPHFELETMSYTRGNEVVKFAGKPSFSSGSISVDDIVGLDTKSILMAWQAAAYDINTRKGGRMADYKRNCTLIEYTQDYEEIRRWKLYGCWCKNISEEEFNREQDGKRQLSATIEYDRAEMIMPN